MEVFGSGGSTVTDMT